MKSFLVLSDIHGLLQFFVTEKCESLPIGHWVIAEAPGK